MMEFDPVRGAEIDETILRDPLGLDVWDRSSLALITLTFVDVALYVRSTGADPPDPPLEPPHYRR